MKTQDTELQLFRTENTRFTLGVTRMDRIRNSYVEGTAQVEQFGHKERRGQDGLDMCREETGYVDKRYWIKDAEF